MKHLFFTIAFISFCIIGNCQTWQPLGQNQVDELGETATILLSIKSDGDTLYAGIQKSWPITNYSFKKYNGIKWDTVCSYPFVPDCGSNMDNHFTPYVFYYNYAQGGVVKKYTNGAWTQVGIAAIPDSLINPSLSLVFGKADTPYILFSQAGKLTGVSPSN